MSLYTVELRKILKDFESRLDNYNFEHIKNICQKIKGWGTIWPNLKKHIKRQERGISEYLLNTYLHELKDSSDTSTGTVINFYDYATPKIKPEGNAYRMFIGAGDHGIDRHTNDQKVDVELHKDRYNVFVCWPESSRIDNPVFHIHENIKKLPENSFLCLMDVKKEDHVLNFVNLFGGKFELIDSWMPHSVYFSLEDVAKLLCPGGYAIRLLDVDVNNIGVEGCQNIDYEGIGTAFGIRETEMKLFRGMGEKCKTNEIVLINNLCDEYNKSPSLSIKLKYDTIPKNVTLNTYRPTEDNDLILYIYKLPE